MVTNVTRFFKPPEYDSIEQSHKARFLHIALFVLTGGCILLGVLNTPGKSHLSVYLFILAGISFLCVPANQRGHYTPVAVFVSGLILVMTTYSLVVGVGLKDAGLIAYPIFIIFSSYLFNRKAVLYATLSSIASVVLVYLLIQGGLIVPGRYSDEAQVKVIIVILAAVGFLFWVVVDNWEKILKDLRDTYDLTLSGWGQALEYRDQKTQGHSERVVEMTIALARKLGVSGEKLEHIRRGALLHDIGKIAVPDAILLKNDCLSDAEWEVVKKHPIDARDMLEKIPFLKPALDIPYGHHERWDGSGYPGGLSGEAIPFAARLFAVVDVWDALTSDRPYRQAWSQAEARSYIQDQSGKQFDPRVVAAFLELIG